MAKLPKNPETRQILLLCIVESLAILPASVTVIFYLTIKRWLGGCFVFFTFTLAFSYGAVVVPVIFLKKLHRAHPSYNWNAMLSISALFISILLLAASILTSIHVTRDCHRYCGPAFFTMVMTFPLSLVYLCEFFMFLVKAIKHKKNEGEVAIIEKMETQEHADTSSL